MPAHSSSSFLKNYLGLSLGTRLVSFLVLRHACEWPPGCGLCAQLTNGHRKHGARQSPELRSPGYAIMPSDAQLQAVEAPLAGSLQEGRSRCRRAGHCPLTALALRLGPLCIRSHTLSECSVCASPMHRCTRWQHWARQPTARSGADRMQLNCMII